MLKAKDYALPGPKALSAKFHWELIRLQASILADEESTLDAEVLSALVDMDIQRRPAAAAAGGAGGRVSGAPARMGRRIAVNSPGRVRPT
jgi:hypothetical protein